MIKTVELTGEELTVKDLNGFNTVVQNLGDDTIYASKYPNITAGADNVAEIPAGTAKLISTTNGTVYLLGNGKAELTGQDHEYVSSSGGRSVVAGGGTGGGTSDVSKAYVDYQDISMLDTAKTYADERDSRTLDTAKTYADERDSRTLDTAKTYTDTELSAVKAEIAASSADIEALETSKADRLEIPTALPANGGSAETANKLATARSINGTAFDGSADITITAQANGGNADTVNGHTVAKDVPENAVFTDTTYSAMTGATDSAAGTAGLVPAPAADDRDSFLRGDGTWGVPSSLPENALTIISISQGTINSLPYERFGSSNYDYRYFIPNESRATKALVEFWTDVGRGSSSDCPEQYNLSNYGSRFYTDLSPKMTKIEEIEVIYYGGGYTRRIRMGVDETGRPTIWKGYNLRGGYEYYRVTWFA